MKIQDANEKLQEKIKTLEAENSELTAELENTKLMLSDVQIKYNMVEKNIIHKADQNTDNILRRSQERHHAQTTLMQQQIDSLKANYEDLEHHNKNLDIRYKELQRSRESMLIEKSEIVNQLTKSLHEAQRQCQDLLSKPDYSQENLQLHSVVLSAQNEKEEMNQTINRLQNQIQKQTAEMELLESIAQECGGINVSILESSKPVYREPLKIINSSTPLNTETRLARVKEELCKSLNNLKSKREEIKICERQLSEKDKEISQLKSGESKALVQMNHYRDEYIRMESKTKILEMELAKMRDEPMQTSDIHICITNEQYEKNINELKEELNNIRAEYEKLNMKNGELEEIKRDQCVRINQLQVFLEEKRESIEPNISRDKGIYLSTKNNGNFF
jgi:chromosome segregation ATPase